MKPDGMDFWIYELCIKLSNDLPYMLDLWLHSSIGTIGETTPVSNVVAHWGCITHSFNVGRIPNGTNRAVEPQIRHMRQIVGQLVFDSYYLDEAGRQELQAKNIKVIGAVNPQRFPLLTSSVRQDVDAKGR